MRERGKSTRHNMMLLLVALLLVVSLIGGTMAWLTISGSVSNTFTVKVGEVNDPTPPTDEESTEDDENEDVLPPSTEEDAVGLVGNIYEPSFIKDQQIALGQTVEKDPYIGLGAGSEKSYVFAWWDDNTKYYATAENATADTPVASEGAFDIAVYTDDEHDVLSGVTGKWVAVSGAEANATTGKSALYVWCASNGTPVALEAGEEESVWTDCLFADGSITVKRDIYQLIDNANDNDDDTSNSVDVYCFIHQALDSEDNDLYDTAVAAAKIAWQNNNEVAEASN